MGLKIIGFIIFLFIIFYKGMYQSFGWWDFVSLLIVFLGSALVWMVYFFLKRKWDFFAKNISVLLGIVYGFIWGIELLTSNHANLIFPLVTIPIGYGVILSIISGCIYKRRNFHGEGTEKID